MNEPLLRVDALSHRFANAGTRWAVRDAALSLYPGEVVAIVGESGSGKSTLLNCIAGRIAPLEGQVLYRTADGRKVDVHGLPERERRELARTEWGFVEQHAADGLRLNVSAGANVSERLMANGTTGSCTPAPVSGWRAWSSTRRVSTTARARSRAACASACRSRATSSPARASC